MQKSDKAALAGIVIGVGVAAMGVALPEAFPGVAQFYWKMLFWAGVAIVIGGILALMYINRPAEEGKQRNYRETLAKMWLYLSSIGLLVFVAIYISHQVFSNIGFNEEWPDAIRCSFKEKGMDNPDDMIFYFAGFPTERNIFGAVAAYFTPAGARFNDSSPLNPIFNGGYFFVPHQVWFRRTERTIIEPRKFDRESLDLAGREYFYSFPFNLDCGGTSINEIEASGNAFFFAHNAR